MESVLEILAEANGLNTRPLRMVKVVIDRAEGLISECDGPHTFEGENAEAEGNAYLRKISETAPKGGCYDKTDVTILFENGQDWEARFDVKHFTEEDNDTNLRQHVSDFLFYHTNPDRIPWLRRDLNSGNRVKRDRAKESLAHMNKRVAEDPDTPAMRALLNLIDPERKV